MKLSSTYLNTFETYNLANKIMVFILMLVFLYPLLTACFHFGFSCQYKLIFGTECRSCGLTRGLQSCMKFDFSKANKLNAQSTFIFIILICQIIFRLSMLLISKKNFFLKPKTITTILSIDLFICITLLIFNLKYYG